MTETSHDAPDPATDRRTAALEHAAPHDWDPRAPEVLGDQIAAYDELRDRCPVAHSEYLGWSVLRHDDVVEVLHDHETFSNAVSTRLTVPNGMDPPEHTEYRRINDKYFTPDRMAAFEPRCRQVASGLLAQLPDDGDVDLMHAVARTYALRVQSAFLGWPVELEEPLRAWVRKNHAATLARDREAMGAIAVEFDGYIRSLLDERRALGADAPDDTTTELLHDTVFDRPLRDEELVSLLRNWTVGELSTIAASVGIVAHFLAEHPDVQTQLRTDDALVGPAVDEILRIHAPLIANRRVTTRPVTVRDRDLAAGDRVTVIWASANRDPEVFGDPDEFRLDRDPELNLLYGTGVHYCPGAPLARLELRLVTSELLQSFRIAPATSGSEPVRAIYPASGFAELPVHLRRL